MFQQFLSSNLILNDKYRIIKGIHSDDSGSIYLVNDLASNKQYTMKELIVDKDISLFTTVMKELKEVAQKGVKVDRNPDSPRIVDFFVDGNNSYLIMDYNDEKSLNRLMLYPSLGKTLRERYVVVRGVSSGGFGTVYLVRDISLPGKYWAVKEMHDESQSQEVIERSFKIEAEMLAKLEHPTIPRVTDFFIEGKKLFLVMDYIKGETLKKMLKSLTRDEYFSEEQVLDWSIQICDVLHYLHNRQNPIVFRDLKPDNIMITEEGQLRLIDFGIARVFEASRNETTKYALLTEGFAPQEQWLGKAEPRSDVYALGATLFYLLTKVHPKEKAPEFPPLNTLNQKISSRMSDIVLKALEPKLSGRYQSIEEMRKDLLNLKKTKESGNEEKKHLEKAREYEEEKEYLKASFEYMKALEFNNQNTKAQLGIGISYEFLGLKDKALEHYNRILNETADLQFQKEIQAKISALSGGASAKDRNEELYFDGNKEDEYTRPNIPVAYEKIQTEDKSVDMEAQSEDSLASQKMGKEEVDKYSLIVETALAEGNLTKERTGYIEQKRQELGITEETAKSIEEKVKRNITERFSPSVAPLNSKKTKSGFMVKLLIGIAVFLLIILGLSKFAFFPPTSEELSRQGREYLRKGDFPKAMERYKKALELYPDNRYARMGLMETYIQSKQLDDFYRIFSQISNPKADEIDLLLKTVIACINARDLERSEKYGETLKKFNRKLSAEQLDRLEGSWIELAKSLLGEDKSDLKMVRKMLKEAKEINIDARKKDLTEAYIQLISKYISPANFDLDGAIEILSEIENTRGFEKELSSIYKLIGEAYLKPGKKNSIDATKYMEAKKYFELSLKFYPGNTEVLLPLSSCYLELKDYDKAIDTGGKIKENPEAFIIVGDAYCGKKDRQNALKCYDMALKYSSAGEIKSRILQRYLSVGDGDLKGKSFDNAIDTFTRAKNIDGKNKQAKEGLAKAYLGKATALFDNRSYSDATKLFSQIKDLVGKGELVKQADDFLAKIDEATHTYDTGGQNQSGGGYNGGGNNGGHTGGGNNGSGGNPDLGTM